MKSDNSFDRLTEILFFKRSIGILMSETLYLLRQQPERISPSLFRATDTDIEIVFIEHAVSISLSSVKGVVVATERMAVGLLHRTITYDDLIEKIFSSKHIIVV